MEPKERFIERLLGIDDYDKGYMNLMAQLTVVGDVSKESFQATMQHLEKLGNYHRVIVIEDTESGKIAATGTLLIEHKFIRNCGKVGHLEDVVVDEGLRGHGLGQRIIEALTEAAKEAGCYKAILDCAQNNSGFYEKCGYSQHEIQMAKYF